MQAGAGPPAGTAEPVTAPGPAIRPTRTEPATGPPGSPAPGRSPGRKRGTRRGKRPASVKFAIATAFVLIIAAAGTLAYTVLVLHAKPKPKPPAAGPTAQPSTPAPSPSASASASLGPYGLIASRKTDPQNLTVAQLFPASFTAGGATVTRVASRIGRSCSTAVAGSTIRARVSTDGCDQAVRATYVSASQHLMGTIGVFNIATAAAAVKAARRADASNYVAQVTTAHGPAHKIGQGTGIEESFAKGHYLILIWAEFTTLGKPKTAAKRHDVEAFMHDLLEKTANVSLTNRMLTGHP